VSIGSAADVDGKSCGGLVDNGVNGADGRRFWGLPLLFFAGVDVDGHATWSFSGKESLKKTVKNAKVRVYVTCTFICCLSCFIALYFFSRCKCCFSPHYNYF
jgi:hypothetical protein